MTTHPLPGYPQAILDLLAGGRDRPVFEHGSRIVHADEVAELVARIAAGLQAAGIGRGTGVAVLLGVSPEAFAAVVAAHVVGARVAGVRPGLPHDHLRHLLGHRIAAVLVDRSTVTPQLRAVTAGLPLLGVGPVDGTPDLTVTPADGTPPVPAGVRTTSPGSSTPAAAPATRRLPPDVRVPRRCLGGAPGPMAAGVRDLAGHLDRYLVFGSLASQVMLEYGILTLAAGGTMVIAEPPRAGVPFFPDALVRHRASASVITVGRLAKLVAAQRAAPTDLGALRALLVSGSPLHPARLAEALDVLGPVVYHGYGQTETGMIAMLTPAEMLAAPALLASVGRPPAVVDVQVRDADGRQVVPGVEGEIFVRTPSQASGYWDDPTETTEVFTGGWVRTRDRGRLDDDGYLHLLGRSRDVVIVNADLRYAGPIERVLASCADVAEAYVVAAPDEDTGEAVHAFVVPAAGRNRIRTCCASWSDSSSASPALPGRSPSSPRCRSTAGPPAAAAIGSGLTLRW